MTLRIVRRRVWLAAVVGFCPLAPAWAAQTEVVAPPAPEADALAAEMRVLAANPNDLSALISAGELALKLGDTTAAMLFFSRADRIDPQNGRLKAGAARAMVAMERPGEALRLFADAERLGIEPRSFAADRGLAYDLVGEQERAQRDYRLALKQDRDDETLRRYALSLGISGKRELALEQIDAQIRKSDRAAWRVRAFVLAMSGDVAGAGRIATSMLPGDMAGGLLPFFQRLPTLKPADRAFAVHFGEVAPTPERLADARLVPPLAPLAPEAQPPVRVAAADGVPSRASHANDRRDRRRPRDRGADATVAAIAASAVPTPPPAAATPVVLAAASPPPAAVVVERGATAKADPAPRGGAPTETPATVPTPTPTQVPSPRPVVSAPRLLGGAGEPVRAAQKPSVRIAPSVAPPIVTVPAPTPPSPTAPPVALVDDSAPLRALPTEVAVAQPTRSLSREDAILSRIIAGIGVPAAELGVAPVRPVAPPETRDPAPVKAIDGQPTEGAIQPTPVVAAPKPRETAPPASAKGADPKEVARKAAEKKLADKKAAEKKAADKKAADEKAAELRAAKADPSRVWVQVAGGSSVRDLPKEWSKLQAKTALLKGRQAWTTPLRFTNRLLTGPFKTDDDAQSFVNQIAKSGLTGFVFTSEAGQKIARLPAK